MAEETRQRIRLTREKKLIEAWIKNYKKMHTVETDNQWIQNLNNQLAAAENDKDILTARRTLEIVTNQIERGREDYKKYINKLASIDSALSGNTQSGDTYKIKF